MSKYLVTGGAGFIGSNIVKKLIEAGHKVTVLDNFISGKKKNLAKYKSKVKIIRGDIRNYKTVESAVKGNDYILHQAALRGVLQSVIDPRSVNEVNIGGTVNVLAASSKFQIERVVLASSSSVYGKLNKKKNKENAPINPLSPYALTKATGEHYARLFYELYGLKTICLRYFNVFGPMQSPSDPYAAVVPIFVTNIIRNKICEIHGSGHQSRDFTYVDNVALANILATETQNAKFGETYNIAGGENISINKLLKQIESLTGKKAKILKKEKRPGDIDRTHADISKAKNLLGYKPEVSFAKGLKKAVDWYLSKADE